MWRNFAQDGKPIYASQCASCHGAQGEGGSGPSLRDRGPRYDLASLTSFVDAKMPFDDPKKCTGDCASAVSKHMVRAFILGGGGGGAVHTGQLHDVGYHRHADLLVSIARAMGDPTPTFGQAGQGPLPGLMV